MFVERKSQPTCLILCCGARGIPNSYLGCKQVKILITHLMFRFICSYLAARVGRAPPQSSDLPRRWRWSRSRTASPCSAGASSWWGSPCSSACSWSSSSSWWTGAGASSPSEPWWRPQLAHWCWNICIFVTLDTTRSLFRNLMLLRTPKINTNMLKMIYMILFD